MSIYQILYLLLLTTSLTICFYSYPSFEQNQSLKIFPVLLSFSVITELIVNVLRYMYGYAISDYQFIYHLYIPFEYALLAYYFSLNNNKPQVRKLILLSIPLFILCSLLISILLISFKEHPGLNFNLSGILLIGWCLITLFSIPPNLTISIFRLPIFWICTGILLFHVGIFFFNNLYSQLLSQNPDLAQSLHRLTFKTLNYILYFCFSLAFLCSNQMKKSSLPL